MKIFVFVLLGCMSFLSDSRAQKSIIENVNIINVVDGSILKGAYVVIEKDRIIKILPRKGSDHGQLIDGTNKYLIPGLWDMHTHNWNSEQFFPLLIANGVTGIRDMFGDMRNIKKWRSEMQEGKIIGPVIYASGPIVDGSKPVWPGSVALSSPDQVRGKIDSLKQSVGVDFVKVYSLLPKSVYVKVAEEAKAQGLTFQGHIPDEVTILEAAKAGQKSQEHLINFILESSDSLDLVQQIAKSKTTPGIRNNTAKLKVMLRTFSETRLASLTNELAKYNTWICPTLTVNRSLGRLRDTTFTNDSRMHYMMPSLKAMWNPTNDFRFKNLDDEYFDLNRKMFALQLKVVKQLHQSGVKLLAGTDFPNPYCFPGFSLHDELQLMVQAGLTPLQALQTATINPAQFIGNIKDYGTVESGKVANLVLLSSNPLDDIRNTKTISGVLVNGKYLNSGELKEMLQRQWHE